MARTNVCFADLLCFHDDLEACLICSRLLKALDIRWHAQVGLATRDLIGDNFRHSRRFLRRRAQVLWRELAQFHSYCTYWQVLLLAEVLSTVYDGTCVAAGTNAKRFLEWKGLLKLRSEACDPHEISVRFRKNAESKSQT